MAARCIYLKADRPDMVSRETSKVYLSFPIEELCREMSKPYLKSHPRSEWKFRWQSLVKTCYGHTDASRALARLLPNARIGNCPDL